MSPDNPSAATTPDLSVILLTADSFGPIRKTVRALGTQTACDRIELIIVCPAEESLGLIKEEVTNFHSVRVLGTGEMTTTSNARAAGIRLARAPVVALAEDHAYPEPGWAEALIEAHKQPWAGVGATLINANPGIVSWVAMVVDYGRWMDPVPSGVIDDIAGHNSSWKRSLLLEYGPRLEFMLPALTILNWDLQAKGYQLYLESAAKVRHIQVSSLWPCLVEQFHVARLFPSQRSENWPWYRRLFYICGMPVLLTRNVRGWVANFRRIDPDGRILARAWPMLLLLTVVWGVGEIVGYAIGMGRAQEKTMGFDTNRMRYVNRRDRALANR
ncbi:MAG: hypothetical protein QOH39_2895 [Verrucomicrobiota bacterium]|jgi:hypothetical protein